MHIPIPGDLISIDKEVDGVIIKGKNEDTKFHWSMVKVYPNQNGLVLETYDPTTLTKTISTELTGKMLQSNQGLKKDTHILVLTIGENIVEVIYNPDRMSILSL